MRRAPYAAEWYLSDERRHADSGRCCLRLAWEWQPDKLQALKSLIEQVQKIRIYQSYDLVRLRSPASAASGDVQLNPDGQNLYTVLRNWSSAPRRFDGRFAWVLSHLKAVFPDTIEFLEFDDFGGFLQARFYPANTSSHQRSLPMHRASDGMLVGLLQLTAVAGARPGSLLAIDEMENQLHPHAIRGILAAMRERAETHNLTIILTTHSPVLMDAFKDHEDQLFVIQPGEERIPIPLDELKDPDWLANFALGSLYDRMVFGAPAAPEVADAPEG